MNEANEPQQHQHQSLQKKYFNLPPQQAELQHRIKTLQYLQEQIIESALLLGSILHIATLTDAVQTFHTMRSNLEAQLLSLKLEQNVVISDSSRGCDV
jgi:hypothetical protein